MSWPLDVREEWWLLVYACSKCQGHWEEPKRSPCEVRAKPCPNGCYRKSGPVKLFGRAVRLDAEC